MITITAGFVLAGAGVFLVGLARLVEVFRPEKKSDPAPR